MIKQKLTVTITKMISITRITLLVCKSLHGLAPLYLSDDCQLVTDVCRRHLRSSSVYTCVVPRTQLQIGDRSFSVAGPRLWTTYRQRSGGRGTTFGHYRRLLKAFFVHLGCGALWLFT